ncbi:MAG: SPOR domain-containing protein [Gemmatimonadota bacterium]|jgi:hypothetical protein
MYSRRILSAALAVLISAAPAAAQSHKVAVSLFGGSAAFSNMASGSGSTIRMQNGWLTGAQAEIPFGRLGLRLNGSYTDRPLMVDSPVDLNVFTLDLDVMMRLLPPRADRLLSPYVALGAGAVMFKLGPSASNTGVQISGGGSVQRPTVMGALGVDIGSGPVAFRVELSDILELHSPLLDASGSAYGPVQHVAASAGLSFRLGGARAAPMRLSESERTPVAPTATRATAEPAAAEPAAKPKATTEPAAATPVATPATRPAPSAKPVTAQATPHKPAADSADAALAARFNAWDKLESLEVEVATLKRRLAEMQSGKAAPSAASPAAATPAPAVPAKAAPSKAIYQGTLYTVQIASYLDGESPKADRAVADLKQKGVPVWVTRTGEAGRVINRVRVGALPDKAAAESLSRYINRTYDWPTWVTPVESSTQVQTSAVRATQAFVRTAAH